MPLKGNPSAAHKKPNYGSNYTLPKGSDDFGQNNPGQYKDESANLGIKGLSAGKGSVNYAT